MASSFIKHTTLPTTSTPFLVNKPRHFPNINKPSHTYKISCKSTSNNNQERMFDRRNVLIGLGSGLYGVTTSPPFAISAPILAPDVINCGPVTLPSGAAQTNCCPPSTTQIIDFTLPPSPSKLRIRPAAHLVDDAYLDKFSQAIERMRALPDDDPRSFKQQANIHCAYCNNAYSQPGFSNLEIEVHDSWLFFPFHRYYIYFFERILGKLINDPTFAMPFWNWDNPEGMTIPAIYTNPNSPLYDRFRDRVHQPPTVVDLNYNRLDSGIPPEEQIRRNLVVMYRQMVSNSKTSRLFFGSAYRRGEDPNPGAGSIETIPHNTLHTWTGERSQTKMEDMGSFYSAGRDPVFYAHHSNVDRMWTLWKSFGGRRRDITDPDFLESGFIFYDEEKRLVRVKIRDCLDNTKLGYGYQEVEIPWVNSRPTPRRVTSDLKKRRVAGVGSPSPTPRDVLPAKMDRVLKMMVERPKKKRSKREKDEVEEILVIEGIELGRDVNVKFDVYINDEDDVVATAENTEFAGSFVNVPHNHKHGKKIKTQLRLSITDIMEDLDAEDDDYVLVTLVPTNGGDAVSIQDVKIELGD